jgi:hypothetical protein
MAIPIAVAEAELPGGGSWARVAEYAYSGSSFNVNLRDGGSFDPDAGSIVAWSWTLLYRPPSSAAALTGAATSTPVLNTVDKEGTYRVFLKVTDDNIPAEDSESDQYKAPDSAFCLVVHKTQLHDWRIPATSERDWADIVYTMWMDIDDLLPSTSQWDVTHQLFFTSGNTAQIQDNRVETTKGGESGLWLNSTTGVSTASGSYYGLRVSPGRQMGAGGNVYGGYITDMDQGVTVVDPWKHYGFEVRYETDPAILTTTNFAFAMVQAHADHDGGAILTYNNEISGKIGISEYVGWAKAEVGATWGGTNPIWSLGIIEPYFFGNARFFLKELTFEHRITTGADPYRYNASSALGDAAGTIKWFTDVETTTQPLAQDIMLMRVVRQEPVADQQGDDFGIMWRESVAELAATPADPDIYPSQTLLMRRPDTEEWSIPGVQRDRVAAPSTPVPFERPGWIQGTVGSANPPSDGIDKWTIDINLPSTVSVDLSEGGSHANFRPERVITEFSVDESDLVVSSLVLTSPNRVRAVIKYSDHYTTRSGKDTFAVGSPTNGTPYSGTVTLSPPMPIGSLGQNTLSIQLTPFMNGSITPPAGDLPIMAVDSILVDGSYNITQFTYIVQPREDDHAVPTSLDFFYQIQAEKYFYTSDQADFHWAAMVTIAQ